MRAVHRQSLLNSEFLQTKHEAGLPYEEYLATDRAKAANWRKHEQQVGLTEAQRRLVGGFVR
ncbi:MAG: hypothetical protein L0219_05320, partial [Phycisphaerales bacterium]|nr:hypothetical protein [Phycisphaerales bacterium]